MFVCVFCVCTSLKRLKTQINFNIIKIIHKLVRFKLFLFSIFHIKRVLLMFLCVRVCLLCVHDSLCVNAVRVLYVCVLCIHDYVYVCVYCVCIAVCV